MNTTVILGVIVLLMSLAACKKPFHEDAKNNPDIYCAPLAKDAGEVRERIGDDGKIQRQPEFVEFRTAAGFAMRIPFGTGGLGHPNAQCEARNGQFRFMWVNGKLVRGWSAEKGSKVFKGSLVEYFVYFSPPSGDSLKKIELPKWMFERSFRVPGHEKIIVLPFADYGSPELFPTNRNDRALWRPKLLLEDAPNPVGYPTVFTCGQLIYKAHGGSIDVEVARLSASSKCMGEVGFAGGAGGRLDIYDEHFLDNGASITRAVIEEVNSYIVKE